MSLSPMRPYCLIFLSLFVLLSACKPTQPEPEETGIFEFTFLARVGGQAFDKDVMFQNILGQRYTVEVFRMYVSDLTLIREDGTDTLIAETLLLDFAEDEIKKTEHGEGLFEQFIVPTGNYSGVRFGIGVPESRNGLDPTDYPSDHPLSVSQGGHWSWTTGYKFIQMDGRIDSSASGTGPLDLGIAYHTGTNDLYRTISYTDTEHAFEVKNETETQFELELDINRMFYADGDTIDMAEQFITHTTPVGSASFKLAESITDKLINNAIYKVPF